jgi:hypothetical protein
MFWPLEPILSVMLLELTGGRFENGKIKDESCLSRFGGGHRTDWLVFFGNWLC